MIVAPGEPISVSGARSLQLAAESLGLTVEVATVVTLSDLNLATESLVNRGVEALINPISSIILSGTTLLQTLTAEYGIPLFGIFPYHAYNGATVAAGFNNVYGEGVIQGRMLVAHLNGDIDISEISINRTEDFGIAVNLDSAKAQNVRYPTSCWPWRTLSSRTALAAPAPPANCPRSLPPCPICQSTSAARLTWPSWNPSAARKR